MASNRQPDRYEPLPSAVELPGWIWKRTSRSVRLLIAVLALGAVVAAVALAPQISDTKREQAEAQRRQEAQLRARRIEQLKAEQRPRFGRSAAVTPPGAEPQRRLVLRARLMDELTTAIVTDARRRVRHGALDGPIRRAACEPFPRSVDRLGAEADLSRRRGRYSCIAVTSDFAQTEHSIGGVIGHQYRALVDFHTGAYAFCKIAGQSGPSRDQLATTPRACGGR